MNIQSLAARRRRAFTLIELMVVITIIALLAGLAIFAMRQAIVTSNRKKTQTYMKAIALGLDRYKNDNGMYPHPKEGSEGSTVEISGINYGTGGAMTLYQALSGDGDDAMEGGSIQSTGMLESVEGAKAYWPDVDPANAQRVSKKTDGGYYVSDGFGAPFQYRLPPLKKKEKREGSGQGEEIQYNNPGSYDLWSYGGDYNTQTSWVTNW